MSLDPASINFTVIKKLNELLPSINNDTLDLKHLADLLKTLPEEDRLVSHDEIKGIKALEKKIVVQYWYRWDVLQNRLITLERQMCFLLYTFIVLIVFAALLKYVILYETPSDSNNFVTCALPITFIAIWLGFQHATRPTDPELVNYPESDDDDDDDGWEETMTSFEYQRHQGNLFRMFYNRNELNKKCSLVDSVTKLFP